MAEESSDKKFSGGEGGQCLGFWGYAQSNNTRLGLEEGTQE